LLRQLSACLLPTSLSHYSLCNGRQNSPILTNTSERQNTYSSPKSVSPEQNHRHYVTSCLSSRKSGVYRPNSNFSPSHLALQSTTSGGNSRSQRKGSFDPFLDGDRYVKTVSITHTPYQSICQLQSVDNYRIISLRYETISCKVKQTHYRHRQALRFPGDLAPRFQNSRHKKVVRLSALGNGCLYTPGSIPGTHFCYRLSLYSAAGRIMTKKKFQWRIEPATFQPVAQCLNQLRHQQRAPKQ
jgi:hypothetical protein